MALDFPTSPSVGQTYSGPGGIVWQWDGTKWVNGVGIAAYAPIVSPVFIGDPQAPQPPVGDNDASIPTTSFVSAAVGTALHNVGRNLLHNPLFNVTQRGTGAWTTSVYTADRWTITVSLDAVSFALNPATDAIRAAVSDENINYALTNVFTGNAGAGACNFIVQRIEDVRRLAGKAVTVSFYAAAGTALKLGVSLTQNFGTGGSPSATINMNGQAVQLTTVWGPRYGVTFTLPSASGKILGTNGDSYTALNLWYSCGTTNAALAGSIGVQSGTIQLWGVQLEIGSVATPLEKPDPQQDLAKCQRFYQTGSAQIYGYGVGAGAATSGMIGLPVTMRALPTATPSWSSITNISGQTLSVLSNSSLIAYASAVAAGTTNFLVSYTASADL